MGESLVEVGKRIRAYRKLKQFTQEEFAAAIGVSLNVIGSIERGRREIPNELYPDFERLLGISREELLHGTSRDEHRT